MYSWSGQSDNPKSENPIEKTDRSGPRFFLFLNIIGSERIPHCFLYLLERSGLRIFVFVRFIGAERSSDFYFC